MTGRAARARTAVLAPVLAVAALVVALVVGTAAPAAAHATLLGSDPAQGAVLEAAPGQVRFTFSEPVAGVPGGVQVFDAQGAPVRSSAAVSGAELAVTLPGDVPGGTLVVVWRVVSEDGHPVSGSLSFSVGAPSPDVAPPPPASSAPTEAPWSLSAVRWVGYVGLFLAAGLVWFTVLLLPAGGATELARRRLVRVARASAGLAAAAWLVALPLTAAYQVGGGLAALRRGSTWSTLAPTEHGVTVAVVGGVLVAVALLGRGLPTGPRAAGAVGAGVVATCAPALTGHTRAATPEAIAVGADMLHLLTGGVWLGGLAALALALPALAERGALGGEVLARFSGVAAGVLAALVATGSLLAWRILGSWGSLVGTEYGRLLLLKIGIAVVAVLIAGWNRFKLLPLLRRATRRQERRAGVRPLVGTTAVEAVVLVAVLSVTGLLVDRSPEADAGATATAPGVATTMLGPHRLEARVTPLRPGPNTITIETRDATGEPVEGLEAPRLSVSSGSVDLGEVPVQNIGPGTYTAEDVVLPSAGTWRLQVSLRLTEFDNPVATLDVTVADD